jgi:GT2 family glycosyltransferase
LLETIAIVRRFPGVRWISEPDEGISDAFNKGLGLAVGDYVIYLNADDYLFDQTVLNGVLNFIDTNQGPDWVVGDIAAKKDDEIVIPPRRYHPSCWSLMFRCRIGHPTVFLKREILVEAGGFEKRYKMAMDYDLWQRLCASGYKPLYFPRIISVFSHEGLTSSESPTLIQERQEVASRFRDNSIKRLVGNAYDQFKGRI